MRLIDADALLDKLPKEYLGSTVHLLINNAPTVPVDEVIKNKDLVIQELSKNIGTLLTDRVQGEWIDTPKGYYCSECGRWCDRGTHNFCPNCGKRMKVIE